MFGCVFRRTCLFLIETISGLNVMNLNTALHTLTTSFTPIIGENFFAEEYVEIDLSAQNKALEEIDITSASAFEKYIQAHLQQHQAKVAYGGYLEKRAPYQRSEYFSGSNSEEIREIHCGMDLWCDAGSKICAPLSGKVHSFKNNLNFGDYGPTIILEHRVQEQKFYTLYGHLSLGSLIKLQKGQKVEAGEVFASLGSSEVNGDYAPHLHFQIIKNLEGKTGDYPGVCAVKDQAYFTENCPDPNFLLKIY